MTTRQIKAKRLTTQHKLVIPGKLRRELLPIAEVGHSDGKVEVVARDRAGMSRFSYKDDELVRVES